MSADTSRTTADKACLPPRAKQPSSRLLTDLLRDVSRSFYLTLRVLPREIRPQISLAYLLARASDTIADTQAVPRTERVELLREFLAGATRRIVPGAADTPAEKVLLERLDDCFVLLASFSEEDQRLIRALHQTIIQGQIFDLETFPGGTERELVALAGDEELDQYTYMVAGCVGEFWTKMCVAHLKPIRQWDAGKMCALGVRFGKGLQLVNILRDMPRDLRIGRCYLPVSRPQALLDPNDFARIEPQYTRWLDTAVDHLDAGWEYTMQIPSSLKRLRLACVWPIWIGLKTIARLRQANPLDPAQRIKVSRGEVYRLMASSSALAWSDAALTGKFHRLRKAAKSARNMP
jgi:farnesyl-diphosphate farnesyltransferase